jgi:hypothetical protein
MGPGTQAAVRPGWPRNENSHVFESDFEYASPSYCNISGLLILHRDRKVHELTFPEDAPRIADLPVHDFFGDGSFYLLNAPGVSNS